MKMDKIIIPPQNENLEKLIGTFKQDFRLLNPYGTMQEEHDYVKDKVKKLPLVAQCPEMFKDVKAINKYLESDETEPILITEYLSLCR